MQLMNINCHQVAVKLFLKTGSTLEGDLEYDMFSTQARFGLSHISGLVAGVMSVVAMVWIDVRDGRGGVTVRTAN